MRCPGWPCDTPFSVFPDQVLINSTREEVKTIVDRCEELTPSHICLTGGEPFLQKIPELKELHRQLRMHHYDIEVFTNGSFVFPTWAIMDTTIMMDWKLMGSGEAFTSRDTREYNALRLAETDGIKFVVTNMQDFIEAKEVAAHLRRQDCQATFWLAPAWGHIKEAELVDWMLQDKNIHDWRFNAQLHKFIWQPDERGV